LTHEKILYSNAQRLFNLITENEVITAKDAKLEVLNLRNLLAFVPSVVKK